MIKTAPFPAKPAENGAVFYHTICHPLGGLRPKRRRRQRHTARTRADCGASALGVRRMQRGRSKAAARFSRPEGSGNRFAATRARVFPGSSRSSPPHSPQCAHWGTFPPRGRRGRMANGIVPHRRGGRLCPPNPGNAIRQPRINAKRLRYFPRPASTSPRRKTPQGRRPHAWAASSAASSTGSSQGTMVATQRLMFLPRP